MKRIQHRVLCYAILVSVCCSMPAFAAQDWVWNYNLFLGQRSVGSSDWDPYEKYRDVGFEGSFGHADEPLMFATDAYWAHTSEHIGDHKVESSAYEINLGLRKTWQFKKRFFASFGSGPAFVQVETETVSHDELVGRTDRSYGWFFGGNCFYRVSSQLNLGIAVHFTPAIDLHFNGERVSGNSTHIGFIIGWGSPLQPQK